MLTSREPSRLSTALRYAVPFISVGAAVLITRRFDTFLEPMRLFFLWVSVFVSSVFGLGPGVVAVALSAIAGTYIAFPTMDADHTGAPVDFLRLFMFILFAAAISVGVGMRRQAQRRASVASQWLSTLMESIADAVIATNRAGLIVFMNSAAESLTGWKRLEALGKPLTDVFRLAEEESGMPIEVDASRRLTERRSRGVAARIALITRTGSRTPIEESSAPIRDQFGDVLGAVTVFHDVTARRALERERDRSVEELSKAELRYRTLVEATPTPQAVWTASPDGVIEVSDQWLEITGESSEQFDGIRTSVHPDDAGRMAERWKGALRAGSPLYQDLIRVRTKDGDYRWFAVKGAAVRDADRTITQWVGVIVDIHDRKRLEEQEEFIIRASELLASSLDYQSTLRRLAQLCVPTLADFCAIDMPKPGAPSERIAVADGVPSRAEIVRDLSGRFPALPPAHPVVQAMTSGRTVLLSRITDEALRGMSSSDEHYAALRSLQPHSCVVVPMTARGRTLGTISLTTAESRRVFHESDLPFLEDLARRAAVSVDNALLYAEAHAASTAKDQFLATLSHELRTPLTSIVGWASLIQNAALDAETVRTANETILRSARAQGELINDLLDLSGIVAGKLELSITTVDLSKVAYEVVTSARPAAEAKSISLELQPRAEDLKVRGDERRLRQVLWNLVSNAVKFTPAGGRIEVSVNRRDQKARIEVRDNGRGIDPSFLPHVWERFRQADSSTMRQHGGLGLGLALVRLLVDAHGGETFAASEGEGKGATFAFELPLSVERGAEGSRELLISGARLAGRRILVVENEDESRHVLTAMLRSFGGEVVSVPDAEEAIRELDGRPFDLVLTDVVMPGKDGYALLDEIRERSDVPVIALSGLSEEQRPHRAVRFSAFVRKPIEPGELLAAVNAQFERISA